MSKWVLILTCNPDIASLASLSKFDIAFRIREINLNKLHVKRRYESATELHINHNMINLEHEAVMYSGQTVISYDVGRAEEDTRRTQKVIVTIGLHNVDILDIVISM